MHIELMDKRDVSEASGCPVIFTKDGVIRCRGWIWVQVAKDGIIWNLWNHRKIIQPRGVGIFCERFQVHVKLQ